MCLTSSSGFVILFLFTCWNSVQATVPVLTSEQNRAQNTDMMTPSFMQQPMEKWMQLNKSYYRPLKGKAMFMYLFFNYINQNIAKYLQSIPTSGNASNICHIRNHQYKKSLFLVSCPLTFLETEIKLFFRLAECTMYDLKHANTTKV